ncbi:MAG: peptidoglycan DD-metalloendopeptidase family protein, partial [Actinomycetota bacterium]|nr:peptidoglycan DD-metalloendopeptidase family protein [Actinomycetota bacterium]
MTTPMRDLASPDPWELSTARSRRRRAITPEARKRLNRRRRASTALTTLMVAGPAGEVLAAAGTTTGDGGRTTVGSPVDRAIGGDSGVMLRAGSTGAAVGAVQERLGVPADGVYGPVTEGAVRDFQVRAQILVDGIVGPVTWTKLFGLDRAAVSAGAARGGVAVIVRERKPAERHAGRAVSNVAPDDGRFETAPAVERSPSAVPPTVPAGPDRKAQAPDGPPTAAPPASGSCGTLRLLSPVKGVRTSPFGPRGGRNHDGVDIAAPTGTAVRAAECGVVTVRGVQGGYGNMVCVEHSTRFETCYAHLSSFAVDGGQTVRRGQVIGYVGCTGSCTGPHVHFETRVDGRAQNPDAYLRGGSVPGEPRVSQAASKPTAKAGALAMAPEPGPQRAAPASGTGSATSLSRAPAGQGAPEPFVQPAPVEQAAPAARPAEPVVAEPVVT